MRNRVISGTAAFILVLLWLFSWKISCAQDKEERKVERQKEKFECKCDSEKTFIPNGEVRLTQWDDSITIITGRWAKTFYFSNCTRIAGHEYFEISNDDMQGFIIITEYGIDLDYFDMGGYHNEHYSFKTNFYGQIRREPLTQASKTKQT